MANGELTETKKTILKMPRYLERIGKITGALSEENKQIFSDAVPEGFISDLWQNTNKRNLFLNVFQGGFREDAKELGRAFKYSYKGTHPSEIKAFEGIIGPEWDELPADEQSEYVNKTLRELLERFEEKYDLVGEDFEDIIFDIASDLPRAER